MSNLNLIGNTMWPIVLGCSNLFPECCQNYVNYENVNVSDGKVDSMINSPLSDLSVIRMKPFRALRGPESGG